MEIASKSALCHKTLVKMLPKSYAVMMHYVLRGSYQQRTEMSQHKREPQLAFISLLFVWVCVMPAALLSNQCFYCLTTKAVRVLPFQAASTSSVTTCDSENRMENTSSANTGKDRKVKCGGASGCLRAGKVTVGYSLACSFRQAGSTAVTGSTRAAVDPWREAL